MQEAHPNDGWQGAHNLTDDIIKGAGQKFSLIA
jgi:hypothetical protein